MWSANSPRKDFLNCLLQWVWQWLRTIRTTQVASSKHSSPHQDSTASPSDYPPSLGVVFWQQGMPLHTLQALGKTKQNKTLLSEAHMMCIPLNYVTNIENFKLKGLTFSLPSSFLVQDPENMSVVFSFVFHVIYLFERWGMEGRKVETFHIHHAHPRSSQCLGLGKAHIQSPEYHATLLYNW